ncbi:hypothetical protein [Acinetobacter sp. YH12153]|uniref:hypothetical protein n=1 Tax=Acinetobacter sp. YH12153 TaxID=2601133 RepID=UPI0015D441ED|nr:hypothetical protein [Acinetobacter sp. YH12153]
MQPTLHDFKDTARTMQEFQEADNALRPFLFIVIALSFLVVMFEKFSLLAYAATQEAGLLKPIYLFHYYTTVQLIDLLFTVFYSVYNIFALFIPWAFLNFILTGLVFYFIAGVLLYSLWNIIKGLSQYIPNFHYLFFTFYVPSFLLCFFQTCFGS